jgi:hypothetical protein
MSKLFDKTVNSMVKKAGDWWEERTVSPSQTMEAEKMWNSFDVNQKLHYLYEAGEERSLNNTNDWTTLPDRIRKKLQYQLTLKP